MIEGQHGRSFSRVPLRKHLEQCVGKTLGELDVSHIFESVSNVAKRTGIAGDVIEYSVLFLPKEGHSKQEPDIEVDGTEYEVKTTGMRRNRGKNGGFEAKEPVSITAVSPDKIVEEEYRTSAFLHKIAHLLFFYYLYNAEHAVPPADYAGFPLLSYQFHEYGDFTQEERDTLERDWHIVRDFIASLQAEYTDFKSQYPRISYELRPKLMLVDTAPKWPHPPRFRFKRSFVTSIYRRHVSPGKQTLEHLPDMYTGIADIERKCEQIRAEFKGRTVFDLCRHFGIHPKYNLKSLAEPIIVKMFGGTSTKMSKIDLFAKTGITGKSIVLTSTGGRTEDTKFFTIDFSEFENPSISFEESQFYGYFSSHKLLFIVFREAGQNAPFRENRFVGFFLATIDEKFMQQHIRPVWERIRHLVRDHELRDVPIMRNGVQVVNRNGELRSAPNFPKSSEGLVFVRGTGTDSKDKTEVVNGIRMYRQQIWIKGKYFADAIASSRDWEEK